MIGVIIAWFFFSFLYFKIIFDSVFDSEISIFAALLMSIVLGLLIFFCSGVYASKLLKFNLSPGAVPTTISEIIENTFLPFIVSLFIYSLSCRLIIFGFSKRLHHEIRIFGYGNEIRSDFIYFLFIVMAPVILHYAMAISSTFYNAKRLTRSTEPEE